jgi:hypothetical protein
MLRKGRFLYTSIHRYIVFGQPDQNVLSKEADCLLLRLASFLHRQELQKSMVWHAPHYLHLCPTPFFIYIIMLGII